MTLRATRERIGCKDSGTDIKLPLYHIRVSVSRDEPHLRNLKRAEFKKRWRIKPCIDGVMFRKLSLHRHLNITMR